MARTRTVPPFLARGVIAVATALPATLPAQGAWSPEFDMPGFGVAGRVFALGTWRNELIAGTYNSPWRDGHRLQHVGRFDGVRWQSLGSGTNGAVRSAIEFQGDLYVGGRFTTAGGVPAVGVARWDGTSWHAVGAGLTGEVWALCQHQGALYASGDFALSGGQTVRGVARWNGMSWLEVGGGLQWVLGGEATGRTLASDGTSLYVGGEFDRAGTTPASHVARWDGSTWSPLGTGINSFGYGTVQCLLPWQGRLYCGGMFGQAGNVPCDNLAAWDGTQWSAVGAGVQGSIYTPSVWSLCEHGGELFVGGNFVVSGTTPLLRIARFDGTQLVAIGGVDEAEVNPPTVMAMTSWNGKLYCGGEFQVAGHPYTPNDTRAVYHVASYDGLEWARVGDGLGFDDTVRTLGRFQGQTIAGGHFSLAGGSFAMGLARFDGSDWRHFGWFDGDVTAMTEHNGELWVAGQFGTVDGINVNGVARWDGTQWHSVGGGPGPARANCIASYQGTIHIGSTGSPKRWTGGGWQTFTSAITGSLSVMHVHQGVLYMGGATPFHPGNPNLFAWNGTTLSVPGGGVNNAVEGLGSFGNELIVGGRFTTAGGSPARSIAKWNGSAWSTFGTGVKGTTVKAITTFLGSLVIGGDFNRLQGENADYVARWTGSGWSPLTTAEPDGGIYALLGDDARGELFAGGWYAHTGTADAGHVAVFETAPFWTDVGHSLGTARRTPRLVGDGRLLPGSSLRWRLSSAEEWCVGIWVLGVTRVDAPILGGTLVPSFDVATMFVVDGIGTAATGLPWFPLPAGFEAWMQAAVLDPNGPQGVTFSNAVALRHP